jgi:hypothetical protein
MSRHARERFDALPMWREDLDKIREYLLGLASRS